MNIAYDSSSLAIAPLTGVGNYTYQLLTHLLQIDRDNSYQLLSHRALTHNVGLNGHANVTRVSAYFPYRLVWMQCVLPLTLRALRPAIAHFPNFVAPLLSDQNVVITVHDLSLMGTPHLFTRRQRILMRPLIKPSAQRARAIIVVSQQSKRDLELTLKIAPSKVHVVHEAAAPFFREPLCAAEREQRLTRYGWDRAARHLLYVGTLEPRKNLGRLVAALHQLHQRGTRAHLWLVGQAGWQSAAVAQRTQALGLERFVHQTGYVSADDLRAFYHACDIFVMPSLHEGFGLPVVEAMACGAPVIVSEIPALREIAGSAALYFDPLDENALAEVLRQVLADETLAAELRCRGRVRAEQFSWERAAHETLAIYQLSSSIRMPAELK